jgi:hypothetical protein
LLCAQLAGALRSPAFANEVRCGGQARLRAPLFSGPRPHKDGARADQASQSSAWSSRNWRNAAMRLERFRSLG